MDEEKKFKISDDEAFENVEKKKVNIKLIIAIAIIMVIAILVIVLVRNIANKSNNEYEQNTVAGNIIMNNGVAAIDSEYIYYLGSNSEMTGTNVYRVKVGTNEYETFYEGGYDIRYLNTSNDSLCFVEFGYQILDDGNYDYDVKIHKVNKESKEDEVLVDNEISYNNISMYVYKNYLYYVAKSDDNVYRINLENNESEMYLESKNGFISISDGYIIYSYNDEETYLKNLTDNEERKISDSLLYTPQIYDGWIYYMTTEQNLNRICIKDGNKEIINDKGELYDIILANGNIFYLGMVSDQEEEIISLYKYDIKSGESTKIKQMTQLGYLNIVGNYVYNMNVKNNIVTAVLTNYNDNTEIELQNWNYNLDETTYKSADMENIIGNDI